LICSNLIDKDKDKDKMIEDGILNV